MKKQIKRTTAIALASVLMIGMLAGCGGKATETNSTEEEVTATVAPTQTPSEDTSEAASDTTVEVTGIDSWTPFAENVTITIPVYDRGVDGLPPVDDNYWTKWVQENFGNKYNITVKYEPIPRQEVMTKYSLLIAAQKCPTILMEYDYPKVSQWVFDGAMQTFDMNEFQKVAPTYYQKMVDNNLLSYSTLNDETYFVLAKRPTGGGFYVLYRMDWLKQVGYDHIPTNRAEEVDAYTKIIAAGLTDQEPINKALPNSWYTAADFREFPIDEKDWAMYADTAVAAFSYNSVKEAIRYDNTLWHLGVFTKEFELNDSADAQADFVAGKTYSFGSYLSSDVEWLRAFYENNPNAELAVCNSIEYDANGNIVRDLTEGVKSGRSDNPYGMTIGFSSQATEDQLKAAWMYLEWMMQPEILYTMQYGIEGINYTEMDELGYPIRLEISDKDERLNYNNNKDMWCVAVEAIERNTPEDSIKALVPQGIPQDFTQQMIDAYYLAQDGVSKGWAYPDPQFTVPIESVSEYAATLQSLFQQYYTELVKCNPEEFDALYEELKQEYLDAGYQQIIDERLAAYEAGKTTKLQDISKK